MAVFYIKCVFCVLGMADLREGKFPVTNGATHTLLPDAGVEITALFGRWTF